MRAAGVAHSGSTAFARGEWRGGSRYTLENSDARRVAEGLIANGVAAKRRQWELYAMAASASKAQVLLAQLVVALMVAFILVGAIWYGLSAEVRDRVWQNLIDRPGGPMTFRFILQPAMAAIAALRDGVNDARLGRSPYFWTVLTNPSERAGRLSEGLISTARIILLGLCMDIIYQAIVLKTFYPAEAVIVALALAFLPYLALRGPIARVARWRRRQNPEDEIL